MTGTFTGATVIAALAFSLAVGAEAAAHWQVVKSGSASGEAALTATVKRPKALGLRLKGDVTSGTALVACVKGLSARSYRRSYRRAGTFTLPSTRHADSCVATASVAGHGRVTVQILKQR